MYILYDNHGKYICKDTFQQNGAMHERFRITTNRRDAASYDTKEKAENVKENCLNRNLKRMGFIVVEIPCEERVEIADVKDENFEVDLAAILDDLTHIDSLVVDIPLKKATLFKALSTVDREISDIHHWLELEKINACQGYRASALLKEKLMRRRDIKNGIEVLRAISDVEVTISNLKNRTYQPRELKELFEDKDYERKEAD